MRDLDEAEVQQVRAILHSLSEGHPARRALREGRSLIEIAHCVEGMQPDVMRPLLELNVHHRRRLLAGREKHQDRRRIHRTR